MDRSRQLEELVESLGKLIAILKKDENCQWITHFERCLERGRELMSAGAEQSDLNDLSVSVMHVYGGMGSFNDYVPANVDHGTGRPIPIEGMESFEVASGLVHERALALRVVGDAL
jgi:hypothetical protein